MQAASHLTEDIYLLLVTRDDGAAFGMEFASEADAAEAQEQIAEAVPNVTFQIIPGELYNDAAPASAAAIDFLKNHPREAS